MTLATHNKAGYRINALATTSTGLSAYPQFDLYRTFLDQKLDSTLSKLATGYKPQKIAGKPFTVKEFILLHTETELVILYRHAGRLCEKVFTDVDDCLEFAQTRFGVTL
jgi:hypothetical protein